MEENENQISGDQVNMQPELSIMVYYNDHRLVIEFILEEVVELTKNIFLGKQKREHGRVVCGGAGC